MSCTVTQVQANPSGLLAYPVRAEDSRAGAMLTKGTVYAAQVPGYNGTLAGKLSNIEFVVETQEGD